MIAVAAGERELYPLQEFLPASAATTGFYLGIAVAAVDGPVVPGLEGYLRRVAAAIADGVVHLSRSAVTAAAAAAPGLTTGRAALRVLVAFLLVELLIVRRKGKF
jgi:hypothetical protein